MMKTKMKFDQPTNEKTLEEIQEEQRKKRMEEFPPVSYISLFRYATVTDQILHFIGILGLCATAAVSPLNMLYFGTMTASFFNYAGIIVYATEHNDAQMLAEANDRLEDDVHTFAVKSTILGIVMLIGGYVTTLCFQIAGINMGYKIRSLYLDKVFNQDISWYDMHQSGDFASRMGDDLTKLEDGIGEKVSMFLHSMLSFAACILMSMIKGWDLALVCLVSLPITAFAMGIIAVITSKFAASESDAYGFAGTIAEETFSSIRTVLAFAGEKKEIDNYSKELIYARDNNIIRSMFGAIGFGILWFCIYSGYSLSFWYGINLVVDQINDEDPTYDAENMIQVFFSIMFGSMNFGLGAPFIETFGMARGAAAKIFGVIDHEPTINLSKNNGKRPDTIKGNIEFKNIEFHYPSRPDVEILRGLNLKIKSGETVALVGSSGCGKSTTIQLIQRFYDPIVGDVFLDGNNVKDLDLTWLRQNIGVVGQEPVLFGTTIGENIRYGNPTATQEMIEKACKKANAHRFISSLPDGYNTIVGERGAQLSGGQKQRIAIARALVRDPAILLLDEATSALDTNSEAKVQAALDNASKECTTIIIAHRLSTIGGANRIVVVNKGRASEEGTHEELMKKKGEYYDLVMTQVSMVDEEDMKGKRVSLVNDEDDMPDTDKGKVVKVLDDEEAAQPDVPFIKVLAMNKPEWKEVIVGVMGAIVMGAAMPVFSVLFGNIISVLQYAGIDNDYIDDETRKYCFYFLAFGIIVGLATFSSMYAFGIAGEKMVMRIRCQMFSTMLRQEIGWYDRKENGVGALCAKLSTDAALIQGATGQRIGTIFQSISTIVISMALAMYYQWKVGLVCAAFTPIILGTMYIQFSSMKNQNQQLGAAIEKSTKLAVEAVGNIRTVASLVCEDHFKAFYAQQLQGFIKKSKLHTHFRALIIGLARSIMFFALACSMYYGGVVVREEGVHFEDVLKVSQSLILGTATIANALSFAPNFQLGIQSAGKVFNLFNRVPRIQNAHDSKDTKWEVGNIEYKNIEFAYPTRPNTAILQGLNLTILRGKTVALVGPSGCGKSTLIQLLERYYDPMAGEVRVDDENLKNITMSSLRSHLGIVSQEPNLFARSIGSNIAYGDNSRDVTQEEIIAAAKKANIHNFVSNLPLGYETPLGDKGAQLSGGQKQRVAIARALIRNPKVLLLDEATSALDTESEKVVQAALDEAKVGRTCITIAHRLTTIQDADVICVVNEGVVHEMGTHHELIKLKGIYHKLYTLQMGSK